MNTMKSRLKREIRANLFQFAPESIIFRKINYLLCTLKQVFKVKSIDKAWQSKNQEQA